MQLALIGLVGAVAAGSLRGGSLANVKGIRLKAVVLVVAALVIQTYFVAWPPDWLTTTSALVIFLGSQLLVAAFVLLNRRLAGMTLVAAGMLLNLFVIGLNGAMPVGERAIELAGAESLADPRHVEHGVHLRNELMTSDTAAPFLADVIPVPGFAKVVSPGDLLVAAGLMLVLYRAVRWGPGKEHRSGRAADDASAAKRVGRLIAFGSPREPGATG
jgi:Family of unknown function (DUF5317)